MNHHVLSACLGVVLTALGSGCFAAKNKPLKEVYVDDFLVGVALGSRQVKGPAYVYPVSKDPQELEVLAREFNCVTAENLMKPCYMRSSLDAFNFEQADEFVDLAEDHDLAVVGHVLVWHAQTPEWFFQNDQGRPVSRNQLIERMRDHIHTIVGHYKGRIKYWDVVNEAVETRMGVDPENPTKPDGSPNKIREAFFRRSPWLEIIGEDYIELAFRFAHEADPEAILIYNDYGMTHRSKAEFVAENIVSRLKGKGVAIHGVGMQAHWHLQYPKIEDLQAAIDIFAAADVHISITELDVGLLPLAHDHQGADISIRVDLQDALNPYTQSVPPRVLERQAEKYRAIFDLFLENREEIDRITFWGISDRDSWLNSHPVRGRTAHPLLFDRNFQPKPAYEILRTR